jgi:membrane-associated phospholipid phosphatase
MSRTGFIISLFLIAAAAAFSAPGPSPKDPVLEWNRLFLKAIQTETTPPPLASRNLAILHIAIFDAINSIDRRYRPFHSETRGDKAADLVAAANAAAHEVSVSLYPSEKGLFDLLYNDWVRSSADGNEQAIREGVRIGETIAREILNWRVADGSSTSLTYIPRTEPGAWRRTPPYFRPPEAPGWKLVRPFAMQSCSQFRPKGPPKLSSPEYAADYNQVKELGDAKSTKRTAEQTQIAVFWSDFSYTITPPGHWNSIAEDVAKRKKNSISDNARLFAILNVAMADTCVAVWDAKYEFNSWRPVTAIREADKDGNDATLPDKQWTPLLQTPNFPEYVSGHAAFSQAAAEVLVSFFGTDSAEFEVLSDGLPGVRRHFTSFRAAAEEIAWSRVYGGIHFWSADKDAMKMGEQIAKYVQEKYFVLAEK